MNVLDQEGMYGRPDPRMWYDAPMFAAVRARDFTRIYRLLQKHGYSQQRIGALTGQSQPEVSSVIHGRKIMAYDVMQRIAGGLGIPRGIAGLCFCSCQTLDHLLTGDPWPPDGEPSGGESEGKRGDRIAEAS